MRVIILRIKSYYIANQDKVVLAQETYTYINGKEQKTPKQAHTNMLYRFLTQLQKQFNGESIVFLKNDDGEIKHLLGKQNNINLTSHIMQKLTSNWSQP